jgi:hypothetical protein
MKRNGFFNYCFVIVCAFALIQCKKTTTPPIPSVIYVSGVISDIQTGAPVDSVFVTLHYNDGGASTPVPLAVYHTDKFGKYSFKLIPNPYTFYDITCEKSKRTSTQVIDQQKANQVINVSL